MDGTVSTRNDGGTGQQGEPIAVVGVSCRFPDAPSPRAFWRLLSEGRHTVRQAPKERRSGGEAEWGSFLDSVDRFDAAFFRISPREAAAMDPRQRLVLELGWEVLEDAGVVPADVAGTRLGVFVGSIWDDYAHLAYRTARTSATQHTITGIHRGIIANRLSHFLRVHGPSMTVDTGQSSSLVAVHLACESLRRGESATAVAAGINLSLLAEASLVSVRWGGLSPDGRCYTFDARANGYVRGEGGGAVLLKPLDRALADGDHVYGVLLGSAVNNGWGASLTLPSADAQADVVRAACAQAQVAPDEVQYVELHGTGTPAGDPVEASALGAALGGTRAAGDPLRVGSVKTNIGHLEGAAGIAGLIKTLLCLDNRRLPASLNFDQPHPAIDLDGLGLAVQRRLEDWPHPDQPLVAGVSSFGMGGTNCHVVLAERPAAPDREPPVPPVREGGHLLPWPVYGRGEAALREQAARLREFVASDGSGTAGAVARALATTRSRFEHRAVVVGRDREALLAGLAAIEAGKPAPGTVTGRTTGGSLAVLFSGQGSMRPGTGRELYDSFAAFADAFDEVCAELDPLLGTSLRETVFTGGGEAIRRTDLGQAALFAVETALYHLITALGVRPEVLAGHSVGELAAAHAAGVLSLTDACTLIAARGRLMAALPKGGAMTAVFAPEAEVAPLLASREGELSVAAVNGPASVVLSGTAAALAEVTDLLHARGHRTRPLAVAHAFHSPLMDPVLGDFAQVCAGLTYRAPRLPVVSTVTGQVAEGTDLCSPEYWGDHVRRPVRFLDAVRTVREQGTDTFLELGPDAVLSALVPRCLPDVTPGMSAAVLRHGRPEEETLLTALGRVHVRGTAVDWAALTPATGQRAPLPTYAFQRRRYWLPADGEVERAEVSEGAHMPVDEPAALGGPRVLAEPSVLETPAESAPGVPLARELGALSAPERRRVVLDLVAGHVGAVLGTPADEPTEVSAHFTDLGMDSMMALTLSETLSAATGLDVHSGSVYDFPTPERLTDHLVELIAPTAHREALAPVRAASVPDAQDEDDPVVVVGIGCRFPGGITTPGGLWRL
ncbi:type I polyketide synthase, partial [Streptomyces sp. NPDC058625]|uniref:type I polyketide synthase n=1 Tax=Streptomyces sp. NPDC058625 TaxID=3346564 RepID=UPI00364C1A8A